MTILQTTPFEVHRSVLPFVLTDRGLTGSGVEVGVEKGYFSEHILKHWTGFLYLVDPYEKYAAYAEEYAHEENYDRMLKALSGFRDRYKHLKMYSKDACHEFVDNSLDFVYLDANHSYESVKEDLECWWPKVKPGGLFAGDDYGAFPDMPVDFGHGRLNFSVKRAVDEWAMKNKRNISIDWFADWDVRAMSSGGEELEFRARNWWLIK